MKNSLLRLAVASVALAAALALPGRASADVVTDWNKTLVTALRAANTPPPASGRVAAIVQVAVYDAVNGLVGRYTPLHVTAEAPKGASRRAAAVEAAYTTLVALFPSQKATFDAKRAASLVAIADEDDDDLNSRSIARGLAWGRDVANAILAWRQTDGFSPPVSYAGGTAPGQWRPTPPGFQPAAFPQLGGVAPFGLASTGDFGTPGPPPLTSEQYAAEFDDVKQYGASATGEPRTIAFFWRPNSVVIWNQLAESLAERRELSLIKNARLFALLNVTMADATTVCWRDKYLFGFWRPITAIHNADVDGNPATEPDPVWQALFPTPNHPDYPSGHATISASATTALAGVFGEDTSFSMGTIDPAVPGVVRSYSSFAVASNEVNDSRVYGGIHYRAAVVDGQELGSQIASALLDSIMLRAHG